MIIDMPDTWQIELKHADSYAGPDPEKYGVKVQVNGSALFARYGFGESFGEWHKVGATRSAVQAARLLLPCLGWDDGKEVLEAELHYTPNTKSEGEE